MSQKPYYYANSYATIYHGDAIEIMDAMIRDDWLVQLVVTDPPYTIGSASAGNMASKTGGWADMMNSALFFEVWYRQVRELLPEDGAMWTFLNWRTMPVVMRAAMTSGLPITSLAVWDKMRIGPGGTQGLRPRYELIALMARPQFRIPNRSEPDIWPIPVGPFKPHGHPAEKPVAVVDHILDVSAADSSGYILDPFMGSGTTLEAAARRGLAGVGIEAEERWCEVAATRLEKLLHEGEGAEHA